MTTPPLVFAVILNFNRWENTLACLASLANADYPNLRVAVFDVSQYSQPPEALHERFPWAEVHVIAQNRGFAGNNNLAIRYALGQAADWVFVLNDDTTLSPECIRQLVECGQSDPRVGMIGPLVYHADEPTVIQSAGGRIDSAWRIFHEGMNELDQGQYGHAREVDWVNGCGFLCRAAVFKQIGLFDEQYFLYNEEVDLCYRTRQAGWTILVEPCARLWHKGVNRAYRPGPNVTYYMVRNYLYFLAKHHAPLRIRLAAWSNDLRMVLSYSLRPKWRDHREHRDAAVQGMRDALAHRWGARR